MTEVVLPSGAILKIHATPFADAKALYQSVLEEMRGMSFNAEMDLAAVFKDIACIAFSSKKIESCLMKCFERCTYNSGKGDLKIDKDTFEPVEAREDYMMVCMSVAKANISPFVKSLYAEYKTFLSMTENVQQ